MPRIRYDFDMARREARWGLAVSEAELKQISPGDGRIHSLIWKHGRTETEELEILEYVVTHLMELKRGKDVAS